MLIQDHITDFDKLAEKADKILQENLFQQKWNDIQNQNTITSESSRNFTLYIAMTILISIACTISYTYYKLFMINRRMITSDKDKLRLSIHRVDSNIDLNEENWHLQAQA